LFALVGGAAVVLPFACKPRTPANHRALATACPTNRIVNEPLCLGPGGPSGTCDADVECDAGTNGRCTLHPEIVGCLIACTYDQCFTDTDCGPGKACLCGVDPAWSTAEGNVCVHAGCRTDSDCSNGLTCSLSYQAACGAQPAYACHTSQDDCADSSDCSLGACMFDGKKWTCTYCGNDG